MKVAPSDAPLCFTVSLRLARPTQEIYQAIADPATCCKYFMQKSSGPIVKGASLIWTWTSAPPITVHVDEAVPGKLMRFHWQAARDMDDTTVTIELSADQSDQTLIKITESGWPNNADGQLAAFDNCSGWQHMLLCLKAWMLHGIELR